MRDGSLLLSHRACAAVPSMLLHKGGGEGLRHAALCISAVAGPCPRAEAAAHAAVHLVPLAFSPCVTRTHHTLAMQEIGCNRYVVVLRKVSPCEITTFVCPMKWPDERSLTYFHR